MVQRHVEAQMQVRALAVDGRHMHIAEHLVVTTRGRVRRLLEPELASWWWRHLAAAVPDTHALTGMHDHLHMLTPPGRLKKVRNVLNGFTARFGIRLEVEIGSVATTPRILGRQIRYAFYNPVRAGLVDDPWSWTWSTLRDLGDACYPIWTPLEELAATLRLGRHEALRAVRWLGEHAPPAPRAGPVAVASLDEIRTAVASTLRRPLGRVFESRDGRRLAVQAVHALEHPLPTLAIAQLLGLDPRSVRRLRAPLHPGLDAVLRVLRDPRLRVGGIEPAAPRNAPPRLRRHP